jgi:hypothetical protein
VKLTSHLSTSALMDVSVDYDCHIASGAIKYNEVSYRFILNLGAGIAQWYSVGLRAG